MPCSRNVPYLVIGALALVTPAQAQQQHVGREQDIVELRLGQRVMVDDGTCPAGQVKEVSGAKMTSTGVLPARKCVPRLGPKTK
jgi:hypothetical protein